MMAGGDGSLAVVAEVAMARDVPFSCVPAGTRNHFAMDLGLDRSRPLQSLDAALDGSERLIDVGIVAGKVFLNNVSFGLYPQAIADPEYRSHRARSMAGAAVDTVSHLEAKLTLTVPDGRVVSDIEMLLTSNNPYRFIGPPDFARRPTLDTGTLGIILADRRSRQQRGPAAFTRWESDKLTVHSDHAEIQAGVDGELMTFQTPVEVAITPKSLRVLVPRQTQSRSLKESIDQLNERAIVHLSGLPTLPSRDEVTARSPLLRQLHEFDEEVFEGIAEWESPPLDRLMPALSQAASHSKIWIAMAAAMSLAGGKKGRRIAVEGLAAVGHHVVSRQPGGQGPLPETATDRSGARGATSADAGFVLDALGPHRICRCIHSRRWRGISRSADPTQCPRRAPSDSPGSTPECTTPPMSYSVGSLGKGSERSYMQRLLLPDPFFAQRPALETPNEEEKEYRMDIANLPRPVGFVLGGGGSLGAVQVGMLQALGEHGRARSGHRHLHRLDQWCSPGTRPQRRSQSAVTRMAEDDTAHILPGGPIEQARTLQQTKTHLFPNKGLATVIEQFLGGHDAPSTTWSCRSPPSPWTSPQPDAHAIRQGGSSPRSWPARPSPGSGRPSSTKAVSSTTAASSPTFPCVTPRTWGPGHWWSSTAPSPAGSRPRETIAEMLLFTGLVAMRAQAVLEAPLVAAHSPCRVSPRARPTPHVDTRLRSHSRAHRGLLRGGSIVPRTSRHHRTRSVRVTIV